jgi:LPXTG-motif cell wall-anchored protein
MIWQIVLNNKASIKMKKAILILSLAGVLMTVNSGKAISQDKPKPKKDTVNMDTDAKPKFYYAVEDDKAKPPVKKSGGPAVTIVMIAGAAVIIGITVYFLLKKKKKD